jgi:hypothetical protein
MAEAMSEAPKGRSGEVIAGGRIGYGEFDLL